MYFTASELNLLTWLIIETALLVTMLIGLFDGMKRDWTEIKRLRADKEALTEILLAFLSRRQEVKDEELTEKR